MDRSRFAILALALLMSLSPVAASAHDDDLADRIDLPDGWRPEGITTDGHKLFVGSLANGAILRADPRTGDTKVIAEGAPGSMTVGVDYDRHRDLLWAAGGGPPRTRAGRSAPTTRTAATCWRPTPSRSPPTGSSTTSWSSAGPCTPPTRATGSSWSCGSSANGGLPGQEAASILPLTGDFDIQAGTGLNGIVAARPAA